VVDGYNSDDHGDFTIAWTLELPVPTSSPTSSPWESFDNYCASACANDVGRTDWDAGDTSFETCQAACADDDTCSAFEWYASGCCDGPCKLITGSTGHTFSFLPHLPSILTFLPSSPSFLPHLPSSPSFLHFPFSRSSLRYLPPLPPSFLPSFIAKPATRGSPLDRYRDATCHLKPNSNFPQVSCVDPCRGNVCYVDNGNNGAILKNGCRSKDDWCGTGSQYCNSLSTWKYNQVGFV
jgi:hypothetical protein